MPAETPYQSKTAGEPGKYLIVEGPGMAAERAAAVDPTADVTHAGADAVQQAEVLTAGRPPADD